MPETTSILVIGKDPIILRLSAKLQMEGMQAFAMGTASELEPVLQRFSQCVAVVDGDLSQEELGQIDELLHHQRSIPTLTLLSTEAFGTLAIDPARAASEEFAPKPASLEELVLRTKVLLVRSGYELPDTVSSDGADHHDRSDGLRHGQVVAVYSAKGGVGKSTIAANLAVGLSQFYHLKALLVDSDLWFGDAGFLLDLNSKKSLFDLCSGSEPDVVSLKQAVVQHSSGASVLLRPSDLVAVEKLDINAVGKMLAVARTVFDFVIVDMRSSLDEMTLQIFDAVDQILLVSTPEVSALANTSRFLAIAEDLGYQEKVSLVINRANTGVDVVSLERALEMRVAATIVSAGVQVVQAANEGVSIFSKYSHESQIAQDLALVVEKVAGEPLPKSNLAPDKPKKNIERLLLSHLRRGGPGK
jgi:pilus assembly protein CpaE